MSEVFSLHKFSISDKVIAELSADQRAMFAVLCLAFSEIEAMRKVLGLGPQVPIGSECLDEAFISQRLVFFRLISMKLLEVFLTLSLSGKENKSNDESLKKFRNEEVSKRYKELKNLEGYKLACHFRNKIGAHYDLSRFRDATSIVDSSVAHSVLFNAKLGYQSYPFGEIALSTLLDDAEKGFSIDEARGQIEKQQVFMQEAISSFNDIFNSFFDYFLKNNLEETRIDIEVPNSLIAMRESDPFPLFLKTERGNEIFGRETPDE